MVKYNGGSAYTEQQQHFGGKFGGSSFDTNSENISTLKNYESSIAAHTKDDIIRKLARAMKRAGINVDPETDLDTITKTLIEQIPNPKKGKTFSSDAKSQEKVCRVVADVLNDEYTPGITKDSEKFIDTSYSAVELCKAVGEWSHSLSVGVNQEFLAVNASVKNALRSIKVLDEVMSKIHQKIQNQIDYAQDPIMEKELRPLLEVYTRSKHERDRKQIVLEQLLHVHLTPAGKALEIALRDESEDAALIKRIGLKPGTSEFGDSLASVLSGLGTAASIANRVHKALKTVGVTVNDYLESKSFKEFQRTLDDMVDNGKIKEKNLVNFLEATKTLREGFSERSHSKFKKFLVAGGARRNSEETSMGKYSTHRRINQIKTQKTIIGNDFIIRLNRHYDDFLTAINELAPEFGKSIPITSKTDFLRDAFIHLEAHANDITGNDIMSIELIISRNIDTVEAKETKEKYINKLKMIADICGSIMELIAYKKSASQFAKIKDIVTSIEKTINFFSNTIKVTNNSISTVGDYDKIIDNSNKAMSSSFVEDSDDEKSNDEIKEGGYSDDDEIKEGGHSDDDDEINSPEIAKSGLTLATIINTFKYYYYIAGVRNNLKISVKEYSNFGDDYNNLLGNSIAKRLYYLEKEFQQELEKINELNLPEKPQILKWVENEYQIKIKFYKALQALDLYLKEFTTDMVKNIDCIKEIKTMLDETQVIARWYNESTGNYLCEAFEHLPGDSIDATGRVAAILPTATIQESEKKTFYDISSDVHYYEQLHTKLGIAGTNAASVYTIGNPEYGCSLSNVSDCNAIKKNIDSAIEHFQALKNIVNTFIRIGNKFGSKEISNKIFMSPSQIYRILIEYLKQSSLHVYTHAVDTSSEIENINFKIEQLTLEVNSIHTNMASKGMIIELPVINNEAEWYEYINRKGNNTLHNWSSTIPTLHWDEIKRRGLPILPLDYYVVSANQKTEILIILYEWYAREIIANKIAADEEIPELVNLPIGNSPVGDLASGEYGSRPYGYKKPKDYNILSASDKRVADETIKDFKTDDNKLHMNMLNIVGGSVFSKYDELNTKKESLKSLLAKLNTLHTEKETKLANIKLIVNNIINDITNQHNNLMLATTGDAKNKAQEEITKKQIELLKYQSPINTLKIEIAELNLELQSLINLQKTQGTKKPDSIYFTNINTRARNDYTVENKLFHAMIKAMAGKILTSIGAYDMIEMTPPKKWITNTRMILGGGIKKGGDSIQFDDTLEIIDGAVSLYFKIPRLVEFYHDLFAYDHSGLESITFLPDLDGIFTGLFLLIFRKVKVPNTGEYSDAELHLLVAEINKIYSVYLSQGSHDDIVTSIIQDIVLDINRKYGLVKKDDINEWIKLTRQNKHNSTSTIKINNTNFSILPDENEIFVDKRAPSDMYSMFNQQTGLASNTFSNLVPNIDENEYSESPAPHKDLIFKFREKLDDYFNNHSKSTISYTMLIHQAMLTIKNAKSNKEKINLTFQLIQGTGGLGLNTEKALLFHETIITGLNILGAIETMIKRYHEKIVEMDTTSLPGHYIDTTGNLTSSGKKELTAKFIAAGRVAAISMKPTDDELWNYLDTLNILDIPTHKYINMANYNNFIAAGGAGRIDNATYLLNMDIDYKNMMLNLLEQVYSLVIDSNGLIDLNINQDNEKTILRLSFIKLQNMVNSLLSDLKFYFEYFRPYLKPEIIKQYENASNPGSIYNMEKRFDGLFNSNTDTYNESYSSYTDTFSEEKYPYNIYYISSQTNIIFRDLIGNQTFISPGHPGATITYEYGDIFQKLITYDNKPAYEILYTDAEKASTDKNYILSNLMTAKFNDLKGGNTHYISYDSMPTSVDEEYFRLPYYNNNSVGGDTNSLMFIFNQLLSKFLTTFVDSSTGNKIYKNLITTFTNGVASKIITNPKLGFPDLIRPDNTGVINPAYRKDTFELNQMAPNNIIFQSLAFILQRISKNTNATSGVNLHLVNTLTDVPLYIKEAYKANLPSFIKLFDNIIQKCEFLKNIMEKTNIDLKVTQSTQLPNDGQLVNQGIVITEVNKVNSIVFTEGIAKTKILTQDSNNNKSAFNQYLDSIMSYSFNILTSSTEVLNELGDTPAYFQTFDGSIEQYYNRNQIEQFMPLSLSLWLLNDNTKLSALNSDPIHVLFPGATLGEIDFKMLYGIRQLVGSTTNVNYEEIPGVKSILVKHNINSSDKPIDEEKYLQFIQKMITGLRFIVNSHCYKRIIAYNSNGLDDYVPILPGAFAYNIATYNAAPTKIPYTNNPLRNMWKGQFNTQLVFDNTALNNAKYYALEKSVTSANNNVVYALSNNKLDKIIKIIENSNQNSSISDIVSFSKLNNKLNRSDERIQIIIDCNINPINVHALMQDIPLANIYNYEYTFETMVASMYGISNTEINKNISDLSTSIIQNKAIGAEKNTIYTFLALLKNPFLDLGLKSTFNSIARNKEDGRSFKFPLFEIFIGNASLGMGRPKFLSDQLFNKCLLNSLYLQENTTISQFGVPGTSSDRTITDKIKMSYIKKDDTLKVLDYGTEYTTTTPSNELNDLFETIGNARFNTHIIRNMFFISNILRIIRLQLNREFTQNRNILKSSHFAISPAITEYGVMDPNESFDSKMFVNTPKEVSQYNDEFEEV